MKKIPVAIIFCCFLTACSISSEKEKLSRVYDVQYSGLMEKLKSELWQQRILSSPDSPYIILYEACSRYVESSENLMSDRACPRLIEMKEYRYYYEKLTERICLYREIFQTHNVDRSKPFPYFDSSNSHEEYRIYLRQSNLYLLMDLLHYAKLEGAQSPYGRQGKEEDPEPLLISIDTEDDTLAFHFLYGRFLRPFVKKEYTKTVIRDAAGCVYPVEDVRHNEHFIPVLYATPGIMTPVLHTTSFILSPNGSYLFKNDEEYR
ncbi:MAG: hypothetical protein IBJ09_10685 [Bacteroidia bacterium]|nr:hypothetical protein [Bacteroidia bacterium]